MMMFSVAMNGSSCEMRRAITFGYTTRPSETFCNVVSTISAVRNASGRVIRRFALSSSVRSNHCTLAVFKAFCCRVMRCRARLQIRSERMGLRLYAMAEDPICVDSNGSSTSWLRIDRQQARRRI